MLSKAAGLPPQVPKKQKGVNTERRRKCMGKGENSGIGIAGILTIVFIVLKLTHVIDWGWIWVVSPIWIEWLLAGLILLLLKLNN